MIKPPKAAESFSVVSSMFEEAPPVIISGYGAREFAAKVAEATGYEMANVEHIQHSDGEIEPRLKSNIHDRNVIFIASASGNPNKQLIESQTILELAHESGAKKITGVFPYMWYNRGDKRQGVRRAITATMAIKNVREHLDSAIVISPHNTEITFEAFKQGPRLNRCLMPNLSYAYGRQLRSLYDQGVLDPAKTCFANIDAGAAKRNHEGFKRGLLNGLGPYAEIVTGGKDPKEWMWVNLEKLRSVETNETVGSGPDTSVTGMDVFAVEDMIASGGSAIKAADRIMEAGARSANLIATHGMYTVKGRKKAAAAIDAIENSDLSLVLTANTYDHSTTDERRQTAIDESTTIHEVDVSGMTGLYLVVLHTPVTAAMLKERDQTGHDWNSPSAIDEGNHVALEQDSVFVPTPIKEGNNLLTLAMQDEDLQEKLTANHGG